MGEPRSDWADEASLARKMAGTMVNRMEQKRLEKRHWKATATRDLLASFDRAVGKFGEYPSWETAADVANFAAMIADVSPVENS